METINNILENESNNDEISNLKSNEDTELHNIINELKDEEQKLKEIYSDFSLEYELNNEKYFDLVSKGLSLKDTYELVHMEDILNKRIESEKAIWHSNMQRNNMRPEESAMKEEKSVINVHSMTKRQRADIAKRVEKGEIIQF